MPVKVVDASAIGAILFNEPGSDGVVASLKGSELAAPTLLPYEVASICLKKIAARPEEAEILPLGLDLLPSLSIKLVAVEPQEALALARKNRLTVYDAAYFWLAAVMHAELVTLDETLAKAWKRAAK